MHCLTVFVPSIVCYSDDVDITHNTNNNVSDMSHVPKLYFNKFRVNETPENFLTSENVTDEFISLEEEIKLTGNTQNDIDTVYQHICELYHREMKKSFKRKHSLSSKRKKLNKCCKPFWNNDLQCLWNEVRHCENAFLAANSNDRKDLRQLFKRSQQDFDRAYRKAERRFKKERLDKIERVCTNDPKAFWKMLKELGPRKKSSIPFEVYDENGIIVNEKRLVLQKWRNDYMKLYNNLANEEYDKSFYENVLCELENLRGNIESFDDLEHEIVEREVQVCINKSKNNKATGIDSVPYEAMKNSNTIHIMTTFFKKLMLCNAIPDYWNFGIVMPIPKPSLTDPRMPLQYRGITLIQYIQNLHKCHK